MIDRSPAFCRIGGLSGFISLWHFPSRKNLEQASSLGCSAVVTLQGLAEDPNVAMIKMTCLELGLDWVQIDFWKHYYQHTGSEGHPGLISLVNNIAIKVAKGDKVLIHCAAGIHRTGMCVYAVLRKLGFSPGDTLECIRQIRRVTFERCGGRRFSEMESHIKQWFPDILRIQSGPHFVPDPGSGVVHI